MCSKGVLKQPWNLIQYPMIHGAEFVRSFWDKTFVKLEHGWQRMRGIPLFYDAPLK